MLGTHRKGTICVGKKEKVYELRWRIVFVFIVTKIRRQRQDSVIIPNDFNPTIFHSSFIALLF